MIYLILPRCYYQLLDTVAVLKVQNNQYSQDITVILWKLSLGHLTLGFIPSYN